MSNTLPEAANAEPCRIYGEPVKGHDIWECPKCGYAFQADRESCRSPIGISRQTLGDEKRSTICRRRDQHSELVVMRLVRAGA